MMHDPIEHLIQVISSGYSPGFDPSRRDNVVQNTFPRRIQRSDGFVKMRDNRVKAVMLESCRGEACPDQRGLPVIIPPIHVRPCVHESLDCMQPGHASCEVQRRMTLFIKENVVVRLTRVIGRVLT